MSGNLAEENAYLREKTKELAGELEMLRDAYERITATLQGEIDQHGREIKEIDDVSQEILQQTYREKEDLDRENDQLKQDIQLVRSRLQELGDSPALLGGGGADRSSEDEETRAKVIQITKDVSEIRRRFSEQEHISRQIRQDMQEMLEDLLRQQGHFDKESGALKQQVSNISSENTELAHQIEEIRRNLENLPVSSSAPILHMDQAYGGNNNNNMLEEENDALRLQNQALREKISALTADLQSLAAGNREHDANFAAVKEEVEATMRELEAMRANAEQITRQAEADVRAKSAEDSQIKSEISRVNEEVDSHSRHTAAANDLARQHGDLQREHESLKTLSFRQLEEARSQHANQLDASRDEIQRMSQELKALKETLAKTQGKDEAAKQKDARIAELEAEKTRLSNALALATNEKTSALEEASRNAEATNAQKVALAELRVERDKLKEEVNRLRSDVDEHKANAASARAAAEELRGYAKTMRETTSRAEHLAAENGRLLQEVADLKADVEREKRAKTAAQQQLQQQQQQPTGSSSPQNGAETFYQIQASNKLLQSENEQLRNQMETLRSLTSVASQKAEHETRRREADTQELLMLRREFEEVSSHLRSSDSDRRRLLQELLALDSAKAAVTRKDLSAVMGTRRDFELLLHDAQRLQKENIALAERNSVLEADNRALQNEYGNLLDRLKEAHMSLKYSHHPLPSQLIPTPSASRLENGTTNSNPYHVNLPPNGSHNGMVHSQPLTVSAAPSHHHQNPTQQPLYATKTPHTAASSPKHGPMLAPLNGNVPSSMPLGGGAPYYNGYGRPGAGPPPQNGGPIPMANGVAPTVVLAVPQNPSQRAQDLNMRQEYLHQQEEKLKEHIAHLQQQQQQPPPKEHGVSIIGRVPVYTNSGSHYYNDSQPQSQQQQPPMQPQMHSQQPHQQQQQLYVPSSSGARSRSVSPGVSPRARAPQMQQQPPPRSKPTTNPPFQAFGYHMQRVG